MADFAYDVTAVRYGLRYRAARAAVFSPLLGNWRGKPVPVLLEALQAQYRKRLNQYRACDAFLPAEQQQLFLADSRTFQYARNCPPFGVDLAATRNRCRRQQLCPFCWALRMPLEAYFKLEKVLYGTTDPKAPLQVPATSQIVHVAESRRLHNAEDPKIWNAAWVEYAMQEAVRCTQDAQERRAGLAGLGLTLGSVVLHTFSPGVRSLRFCRHTLAVVPQPVVLPEGGHGRWKVRRRQRPASRRTLAWLVGQACAYPRGMFRGDPEHALAVFRALHKVRTLAGRGRLTVLACTS